MATLVVFSHPNHELAVFGLLQRWRPHLLYLTDGGGPDRVAETRRGLALVGLEERAVFLDHPEQAFYDALLDHDRPFFENVVEQIRRRVVEVSPERVLCDGIEFYNPVHDLSLPLTQAAIAGMPSPPALFEIPLIYQAASGTERYEVQRRPPSRRRGQVELYLTAAELTAKAEARDRIYTILGAQLGPVIADLPRSHLALEVIGPAYTSAPAPPLECVLRYDRRATMLQSRGDITRAITYHQHYVPAWRALTES